MAKLKHLDIEYNAVKTVDQELIKLAQLKMENFYYDFDYDDLDEASYFDNQDEEEEDWDGSDETIMVGNETLWEYIENMPESKHDLLKDCLILVTQHFENRVKEFIKHILLGQGKDKDGKKRFKIRYYSYRIEFQARGTAIVKRH